MNIPGVMAQFAQEIQVKTPEPTILRYATPAEIAHVQGFSARIQAASTEVQRVEKALYEVVRQINSAKTRSTDRSSELAARVLGEGAQTLPSVTTQSVFDLEATRSGLEGRLSESRARASAATGQRKSAYGELLKACGERARAEYVRLAGELGTMHQLLAVAQSHLRPGELISEIIWGRLFVPGFDGARPADMEYGIPRLASGFENARTLPRAQDALRQRTAELFGEAL